ALIPAETSAPPRRQQAGSGPSDSARVAGGDHHSTLAWTRPGREPAAPTTAPPGRGMLPTPPRPAHVPLLTANARTRRRMPRSGSQRATEKYRLISTPTGRRARLRAAPRRAVLASWLMPDLLRPPPAPPTGPPAAACRASVSWPR